MSEKLYLNIWLKWSRFSARYTNHRGFSALAEVLSERRLDGLGNAVEILINEAMRIERDRHLNAAAYERTDLRSGYANGFKPKQLKTRLGELNLQIPQVREGNFYPSFLERGLRSERALKHAQSASLAQKKTDKNYPPELVVLVNLIPPSGSSIALV